MFRLLDFRGHGGDGDGGGLFCWWWVVSAWVQFVICGYGFVLWCAMGLFYGGCGFVGGGCGCGC